MSGTDVTWQFTDLEPTGDDNVYLTVLAPEIWRQIQAAQREAVDTDSPQAHLHLARTLADTIAYRNLGPEPFSPNTEFAVQADLAYQRALELDPQSGEVYVEYLEFMVNMWSAFEPLPDNWLSVLERAWELNPDDERLPRILRQVIGDLEWAVQVCPIETPDPTPTPVSVPSVIYTPLPMPTERATATSSTAPAGLNSPLPTPTQPATATSLPANNALNPSPSPAPVSALSPTPTTVSLDETTPTLSPTPSPVPSPTPITQPTLIPTSAPASESDRGIPGSAVTLGLLSLAVLCGGGIYYIKRQRPR